MRLFCKYLCLVLSVGVVGYTPIAQAQRGNDIRLVLQITVDGLRGDLLNRYRGSFIQGGFSRLLEGGTVYTNAHYLHANTETIVGHTTLSTGTFPNQHGMIGNVWFDRHADELAYNIEDPEAPILPTRKHNIVGEQVDPAQNLARTKGRSPRSILVPTLGDGLIAYYAGKSRVFAISGKDRSAVAMAGQAGKAFWFSSDNGDFVTSSYYYDDYPTWVSNWNGQRKADKHAGTEWELSSEESSYLLAGQDDRPYEADLKGYGRTFPHSFGDSDNKLLYTQMIASPVGDQLLSDFAKKLVTNEHLGQDSAPDYLSVSFSGVDAVNHFFGPSSLENEEIIRRLDQSLADLFNFVEKTVGLKNTLIIFSADHGIADMPEYMTDLGYSAGRLVPEEIVARANQAGEQLGIDEVVQYFYRPYIYLNKKKITAANQDYVVVEQAIVDALTGIEGINLAVSTRSLDKQTGNSLYQQVIRNQHIARSGDIYIIQEPYWFLFDEGPIPNMHGSPWRYDTHVPIMFSGPGINAQSVHRPVHPVDVAPTIAAFLGMTMPAAAQGTPLKEVLQ